MKECTKCGETKPLTEFSKSKSTRDGIMYVCKLCCNDYGAWYRSTPSGIYTQIKGGNNYYKKHKHTITKEEFLLWYESTPKFCAYCDLPENLLEVFLSQYTSRFMRFTIDCIDPDIGYAKDNLALACDKCNATKNNIFSFDEMREIAQKYIKPKWQALVKRLAEQ